MKRPRPPGSRIIQLKVGNVNLRDLSVPPLTLLPPGGTLALSEIRERRQTVVNEAAASVLDRMDDLEVVDLTRRLIRFDTTNPPGNEGEAIRYLGAYLAESGIEVQYQEVEPERLNLIARLRGESKTGHLVLSGHMDVVPAGTVPWEHDPFAADLVDGRIVGRGSADMKGGVAAMVVALATLARSGFRPRADLIQVVSSGEEAGGAPGAKLMVSSGVLSGATALVVGEPTGLQVCPAQKGVRGWQITAHGRACHSSTPDLGISAISYLARVIPVLEANPFPFTPHPLLGEPTISVTQIQGGSAPNVIPEECRITVVMRLVPGQDGDALDVELRRLLTEMAEATSQGVRTEIEGGGVPALETPADHPLVQTVRDAVAAIRGAPPALIPFTGTTEAGLLAPAYRLPMVICGPGRLEQAHETNEHVEVAELQAAVRAYALAADGLLGAQVERG